MPTWRHRSRQQRLKRAGDFASIVVLAHVVEIILERSSEEAFAAFARQCDIVHSRRFVPTHLTLLWKFLIVHLVRSVEFN